MLRKATTTASPCCCCCCGGRTGRLLRLRGDDVASDADSDSDSDSDTDSECDEACAPVAPGVLVRELGAAAPLAAGLTHSSFRNARRLARAIQSGVYVLFITGAGVSVASGIRTFRTGTDGLWNNFVYEVCVFSLSPPPAWSLMLAWGFGRSGGPRRSSWQTRRRGGLTSGCAHTTQTHGHTRCRVLDTSPLRASCSWFPPFHLLVVVHSSRCYHLPDRQFPNVRLATQNIDRLHLRAGVDPRRIAEVHGALGVYRCTN